MNVSSVRRFDSLRVFIKHAKNYEQYDAMNITIIQVVFTIHIKYIAEMLIFFLGWQGRDHDGRGTKATKGINEGEGLQTINPEIHSQRGRSSQGSDPPALSNLP